MKRLILITGLLVALLGLIRSVNAETVVGYGSNAAGDMGLGTLEAMDFNINETELWVTDFDNFPSVDFQSIDPEPDLDPPTDQLPLIGDTDGPTDPILDDSRDNDNYASPYK